MEPNKKMLEKMNEEIIPIFENKLYSEIKKNKDVFHYFKPIPLGKRLGKVEERINEIEYPVLRTEALKYFRRLKKHYKKDHYTGEQDCKFFWYFPGLNNVYYTYGCDLYCQSQGTNLCDTCDYSEKNKDHPFDDFFAYGIERFNKIKPGDVLDHIVARLFDCIIHAIRDDWERMTKIWHNLKNLHTKRIPSLFLKILQWYFNKKHDQFKGDYWKYNILL